MNSIDERLVLMKFNNKDFEEGIKVSQKSLQDLEKTLKFDGARNGLSELERAGRSFSLSSIADNVEHVASKFSVLGVVGFTTIQNLTNAAIDFGKRMGSGILDPLVGGGKRRALNIEQAKFQFAGLGIDVEKAMTAANNAVLGTAYGLDEAAKTAAQFGASGMKAGKQMEKALRGISGVAALSGSSYEEISNVFTKVAGQGRLMGDDLNRLAARGVNAAATLAKELGKTESEVRKMVSEGKISFKTFANAMDDAFGEHATKAADTYTGALAQMRTAFSRIGADYFISKHERMRKLFNVITPLVNQFKTALEPIIHIWNKHANASNKALRIFIKNIDTDMIIAIFKPLAGALDNILTLLGQIRTIGFNALAAIFPPGSDGILLKIANGFEWFTSKLVLSEEAASQLTRIFRGIFSIFGLAAQLIGGVASGLGTIFSNVFGGADGKAAGNFLELGARIGDMLVNLNEAAREGEFFKKVFSSIGSVLSVPIVAIQWLIGVLGDLVGYLVAGGNSVAEFFSNAEGGSRAAASFGERLLAVWEGIKSATSGLWSVVGPILGAIGAVLGAIGEKIGQWFSEASLSDVFTLLNTVLFGTMVMTFRRFANVISTTLEDMNFAGQFKALFGGLTDTLGTMQNNIRADTIIKIAIAVGILAVALVALSLIEHERLRAALGAISLMFINLGATLLLLNKSIGDFDWKNSANLFALSVAFIALSVAILILTAAIAILGRMDMVSLAKGLGAVGALLLMLNYTSELMVETGADKNITRVGLALIPLAWGVLVLSAAVKMLGGMDTKALIQGVVAVGVLMVMLSTLTNFIHEADMLKAAFGILVIGIALNVMVGAIAMLGRMDYATLEQGLIGLGMALLGVLIFVNAVPEGDKAMTAATSLLVVAGALMVIAAALSTIGSMSWGDLAKGLIALGLAIAVIAITLSLLTVDSIVGAHAILVVAGAMLVLAMAMSIVAKLGWKGIAVALVGLTAAMLILAAAAVGVSFLLPFFTVFAIVLVVVAGAMLMLGVAIFLLSASFVMLSGAGIGAASTVRFMLEEMSAALPTLAENLAMAFVMFVTTLGEYSEEIRNAFVTIFGSMLEAVNEIIPKVGETFTVLIDTGLKIIRESSGKVFDTGWHVLLEFLRGIEENLGELASRAVSLVETFANEVTSQENVTRLVNAGVTALTNVINGIAKAIDSKENQNKLGNAGENLGKAALKGIVRGLENIPLLGTIVKVAGAAARKVDAGMSGRNGLDTNSPSRVTMLVGEGAGEGLIVGLQKTMPAIEKSGEKAGRASVDGIRNSISSISDVLNSEMDFSPTIAPVLDMTSLKKDAKMVDDLFGSPELNLDRTRGAVDGIDVRSPATPWQDILTAQTPVQNITEVHYEQHNTSPKALSAIDIYRQTKNQLSTVKGALDV